MRKAARLALVVAATALAACHGRQTQDLVLKIASQRGSTRAVMEAAGVLQGAPYKIEWSEFPSAQALLEALDGGAVDAGLVGDAPFMFAYASGAPIKAVQALRADNGGAATAIVVPAASPIRSLADLKGRRIAAGKGSIGHYLLLLALARAGLKPSDVTIVFLAPGDAKAALTAGSVDAWASWDPYVAQAVLHDHDQVLVNGRGLLHDVGFEAASDTAIAGKHAALDDFLGRLAKAWRWAADNPGAYAQVLSKQTGLPLDVAVYTVKQRGRYLAVPIDADVEADERAVMGRFHDAGVIANPPDVHAALDPSFNDAVTP
ncbi:MAG: ABC transporter substrate-binding protein [Caulobacteraceae bacterium]|nr:ABC transporter substrate-binding protein [Caulobacteraceae bacterium]